MPLPFHMFIKGVTEKACEMKGREDSVLCQEIKYKVSKLLSAGGERTHSPLTITKAVDRASPLLYKACCQDEILGEAIFKFYRINPTGNEEHFYTIKLEKAIVLSVEKWMPNALDKSKEDYPCLENVSFAFEQITWTWEPDGIEHVDVWGKRG